MLYDFLKDFVQISIKNCLSLIKQERNYLTILLRNQKSLKSTLSLLKFSSFTRLNTLTELTAYDCPRAKNRFILLYFLLTVEYNFRLILTVSISDNFTIPSISDLFLNASWSEREIRDMFGIFFLNNQDLRRLLTDYGFEGFPLRKDFPLTGYIETRYDDETQRIIYEPLQLSQEFRIFSLVSPWEKTI